MMSLTHSLGGDRPEGVGTVARELGRLDAYSFFVLPGHDWSAWLAQQWDRLIEPWPPALPTAVPDPAMAEAA